MYVVKFLIFSEYFVFFLIQRNMTKNEIYDITISKDMFNLEKDKVSIYILDCKSM